MTVRRTSQHLPQQRCPRFVVSHPAFTEDVFTSEIGVPVATASVGKLDMIVKYRLRDSLDVWTSTRKGFGKCMTRFG
jgi:hypothetical protein